MLQQRPALSICGCTQYRTARALRQSNNKRVSIKLFHPNLHGLHSKGSKQQQKWFVFFCNIHEKCKVRQSFVIGAVKSLTVLSLITRLNMKWKKKKKTKQVTRTLKTMMPVCKTLLDEKSCSRQRQHTALLSCVMEKLLAFGPAGPSDLTFW